MKRLFALVACCSSILGQATVTTFSPDRFKAFYDVFLCQEKDDIAALGLTSTCTPGPTPIPVDPIAPLFKTGLLPIVLVNHSGLPDSEVYVLITADNVAGTVQNWGQIDTTAGDDFGNVTLVPVEVGQNGENYTVSLSQLPLTRSGRVVYAPALTSGLIWFSMNNKLSMTVNAESGTPPNVIVQPNFTNPSDANYATNYDIFEFTFLPDQTVDVNTQVSADATAVSFFSIPLYGFLQGATSSANHTGLYQTRNYVMTQAAATLSATVESSEWDKLFLTQDSTILRLLSTGKSISASAFDANYYENVASYGYSYLRDIWNGPGSYYKVNPLNMRVVVTSPGAAVYTYVGNVDTGTNEFVLTSVDSGAPTITFPAPVTSPTPTGTTTYDIFSAINFISPIPTAGTAEDATSKLLQEAMIAGIVPTTDTLTVEYLPAHQSSYYTVNTNLASGGQSTGPWYDAYSKALHAVGSIYTYGFDEVLWPQVLIQGPFVNNSTYLGITIGNVQ